MTDSRNKGDFLQVIKNRRIKILRFELDYGARKAWTTKCSAPLWSVLVASRQRPKLKTQMSLLKLGA